MISYVQFLRQQSWPLVGLIKPCPGFRIGSPELSFTLAQAHSDNFIFENKENSLRINATLQLCDSAVVISHRLENAGPAVSPPIDVLEPLRLIFSNPSTSWRHIFANGGAMQSFYPPTAYCTREFSDTSGKFILESAPEGRSSSLHLPLMISLSGTAAASDGFFCGLEWSGAWYFHFEELDAEQSCLNIGVKIKGLRLDPGETLELPPVHLGFFSGGPAAGTNALRAYLYQHVCPPYAGQPVIPRVSYDHWFGIGNQLNFALMKKEAERAAELGVEVFVVDAAWFSGGFPDGVGNWHAVDAARFPNGLETLAAYVRSLGMDFGLWFEIERAVEGTTFAREHPEWFVAMPWGKTKLNYHLNLAHPEAQDHVIKLIGGWIERLDLRWSRWDYNIDPMPFWQQADHSLKVQFAYYRGLYRVLDALMAKYPRWMVEGCSSGGCRIDIGTMRRAHTFWFSDQTEKPRACRYMQARANRFLPGHLLNSSVAVGRGNGDSGFDDTAILSRMLGKLAFDGDIASWSTPWTARARRWVEVFKSIRHLLVQDFYQLLQMPTTSDDADALEFVSHDGREAVIFMFAGQIGGKHRLFLCGLKQDGRYALRKFPDGEPALYSGADLMRLGMATETPSGEGQLWHITEESRTRR